MKIDDWRSKIDAVDAAMLQLLNLRTELVLEIGRLKGEAGLVVRVPERERALLDRMRRLNSGPLDARAIATIYRAILDESIRMQTESGSGAAAASGSDAARARTRARASRGLPPAPAGGRAAV